MENTKNKLKASFTIEITYILFLVIVVIIIFILNVYKINTKVVSWYVADIGVEKLISREDKYNINEDEMLNIKRDIISTKNNFGKLNTSKIDIISDKNMANIKIKTNDLYVDISKKVYNPENFIREVSIIEDMKNDMINKVR